MGKDLRYFMNQARLAGPDYYRDVTRRIDPSYEIGVLQHKLAQANRFPVLYCPDVAGSKLPLVTNTFASYELLGLALDLTPEQLARGFAQVLAEYQKRSRNFIDAVAIDPACAPAQEVILTGDDVDLNILPICRQAELNPERYVAIGMTVVQDPESGIPNAGVYRQEYKGKKRLACMMRPAHHGARVARQYAEMGKLMPVVTVIGHHPAAVMAAAIPSPAGINEYRFAGGLLNEPLEVVPAATVGLMVPAFAEIVIEGTIDPQNMETEGPFSEAGGYYGDGAPCYIIDVSAITMRRDAIYHELHPTHQEVRSVGILGREAKVWDGVEKAGIEVRGARIGPENRCGKLTLYVSISKQAEDEGLRAGIAALEGWPVGKTVIVVDDDIDVSDEHDVMWALATRISDARVVSLSKDAAPSVIPLSEAGAGAGNLTVPGSRLVLDATKPVSRPFPTRATLPRQVWESVRVEDYVK